MSDRNIENAIEWLTGQDTITVSLTQKRFINRVRKLAKKYPKSIEIVAENNDGSIMAHLPINALHLSIRTANTGSFPSLSDIPEEDEDDEEE